MKKKNNKCCNMEHQVFLCYFGCKYCKVCSSFFLSKGHKYWGKTLPYLMEYRQTGKEWLVTKMGNIILEKECSSCRCNYGWFWSEQEYRTPHPSFCKEYLHPSNVWGKQVTRLFNQLIFTNIPYRTHYHIFWLATKSDSYIEVW